MVKLLSALFGFFDKIAAYFNTKQIKDAGRAEEALKQVSEVEERVEKANNAVSVPDAVRTERLRNKYDRSRTK